MAMVAEADVFDTAMLFRIVRLRWKLLVGWIAVMMGLSVALYGLMPFRWQASTILLIGQMPLGTTAAGSSEVALIEPPLQTVERLNLYETENKILASVGASLNDQVNEHTSLFRSSLKAHVIKGTNFVHVSLSGFSTEEAQKNLRATAQVLIEMHSLRMAPIAKRMAVQIQENEQKIASAEAERLRLQALLIDAGKPQSTMPFAPSIAAINLLDNKIAEIHKLMVQRAAFEDLMGPAKTYPTAIVDPVHVESTPYFPKLGSFLGMGILLGFITGMALVFYRDQTAKSR